jgi:DNA-directed RNA polymerase I subunit RPA1
MHTLIDYRAKGALTGLVFNFYNSQEILKLSVKEITNPQSLDRLLNPVHNGLYDLALGPLDKNDICLTCGLDYLSCPGHFGHINLVLPVFNPVFFKELIKLMRMSCITCCHFLTTKFEKDYFYALMTIVNHGLINKLHLVRDLYSKLLNNTDEGLLAKISFRKEFHDLILEILTKENEENGGKSDAFDNSVKNVIKEKLDIMKEFCDVKLKTNRQICPNCGMPLRQLRAEHSSKLFYAKGVSKRQLKQSETKRILKKTSLMLDDEAPADLEPDFDIEKEPQNDENVDELDEKTKALNINGYSVESRKLDTLSGQTYITPIEAKKFIIKLIENEKEVIELMYGITNDINNDRDVLSLFFFDRLSVPPSKFRPISQFKEQKFENAQTVQLSKVIQENAILRDILAELIDAEKKDKTVDTEESKSLTTKIQERLQNSWLHLQTIVNTVYDSDLDKINTDTPHGLKQLLEKKEGLFRKHMMGKRVNYAGRSVISPDLYIGTDEIGIPEVFAKKLTYPQPVNSINFWDMRQLVLNGPDVYPGAAFVQYGNGTVLKLKGKDYESRLAIAKQLLTPESSIDSNLDIKIVHRHLKNGDALLFNRQPTLHRPSIMAHKARVLTNEKTLRLHYSNCKAYNADFDGDEMNAHLPQNEIARAEALNLMAATEHYLVPKDGTPLGGLIHDHIIGGVMLTIRGQYFNRSDYQMLVYNAFGTFNGKMKFLPPAILKPCELWTGKQVVSSMLLNLLPQQKGRINLDGKTKIGEKTWYRAHDARKPNWSKDEGSEIDHMSESTVLIRDSNLLIGVIDKAHCGASLYSLVHCCYELYGGETSSKLLTNFGKLFTAYIQVRGFTLGVQDILLTNETYKPRSKLLKKSHKCGNKALAKVFHTEDGDENNDKILKQHYTDSHLNHDDTYMKEIDLAYKSEVDGIQNKLVNLCFPGGLLRRFPYNNLQLMIQSGAKGSTVNSMQMSCLLGQQELEGRRPRLMPNGNTLPSFLPYESSPNSGGFICNSFMSGLTPQEYFFHCMAGREGLVDTAVKTSRSGYLQRCLVKHLEGIVVNYDLTVRDSDGSVIQFQYGEDSLAVEKTQFLNDKQFPFLVSNYPIITANRDEMQKIRQICHHDLVEKTIKKIKDWKKENRKIKDCDDQVVRWSPFLNFSRALAHEPKVKEMKFQARCKYIVDEWKKLDDNQRKIFKKGKFKHRLPITVDFNPDRFLGAISEHLQDSVDKHVSKNERFFIDSSRYSTKTTLSYKLDTKGFQELIYLKSLKSCVTPGHGVGVLAAQSIGEPSTQMTLNTFHFAGRGDMNVTLGIPRLREILMVASSNIKTPSMEIPIRENIENFDENIGKLKSLFTRILLWDCINEINITQELQLDLNNVKERIWLTKVKFKFIPEAELSQKLSTNLKLYEVLNFMETKFFKQLCISINKKYNQMSASDLLHATSVRDKSMKNFRNINTDENDEAVDQDDMNEMRESGESSGEKLLNKVNDELEYVGEDEERDEIGESNEDEGDDNASVGEAKNDDEEEGDDDNDGEVVDESDVEVKKMKKKSKKVDPNRISQVLNISNMIDSYSYDPENKEWCEVSLKLDALKPRIDLYSIVQKETKQSYIAKIENIKRCFISKSTLPDDNGCHKMITEGINIKAVIKYCDLLDISKLYLNDIHKMASTFGIEAAVKVIIRVSCFFVFFL